MNTQTMTVTLNDSAIQALTNYRQAVLAFEAVGHGTDEGADLYMAAERAAEDLGNQVAALAPAVSDSI